ncbi:hypothetical protein CARUB_v10022041mg [Capsella rubella]|uniref:HMA domain-containing protein n=2 Tax=Capsella rubella TaxID=81985 RepID=R0I8V3_9BRAS|nr:hypothetical protein CARUB_v10022041mg [Capsella rubella]
MIVSVGVYDQKSKDKIMKILIGLAGIDFSYIDLKEGTLIVIGDVDPVAIVAKLRRKWGRANLTLFVPCTNREVRELEALLRSNSNVFDRLHVPTPPHSNHIVNSLGQGCVIC